MATKIIEDFMLMANETVAEDYIGRKCRSSTESMRNRMRRRWRNSERSSTLWIYIADARRRSPPEELQKLLEKIEGTPEEALLSRLTLRSMKRRNIRP